MVWSAQLQVVFPCIELRRISFIRNHHADLAAILTKYEITQGPEKYRVRIFNPMDLVADRPQAPVRSGALHRSF